MTKHCIIPDCQVKEGCDFSYLRHIGQYIVDKKPEVVVCLGDFADMPSLSSYDFGKKDFEGRRYKTDVNVAKDAMNTLLGPLWQYNRQQTHLKKKHYIPRLVLTLGNHEERINKAINSDPKLEGTLSVDDLSYQSHGWEVYPFLEPVVVDGVTYSHYFTSGVMGRPVTSARALLQKKHMSCIMGHHQTFEIHTEYRGDGKRLTGMFAGCCYTHNEDYLGPQGNNYFRGIHMLYEVTDGEFYHMAVSLDYLKKKYE